MSFGDVRGHERIISALRAAMERGRLPHALLFAGPPGIGKRMTAVRAAAALLCREAGEGDYCGSCRVCRRVLAGTHPDVTVLRREEGKRFIVIGGDDDAPGGNVIHSVRLLRELAWRRPFEGDRKVFVVDEAERMTPEAQDAFLKTLEEPPPGTWFFVVCSRPEALKETIRSRCTLFRFYPLPPEEVEEIAKREAPAGTADEEAELAAAFSAGSPGAALASLQEGLAGEMRWFLDFLERAPGRQPLELSEELLEHVHDTVGKSPLEPVRERLAFFLGVFAQAASPGAKGRCGKHLPAWLSALEPGAAADVAEAIIGAASDLKANIRPLLVLDNLFSRITAHARRG